MEIINIILILILNFNYIYYGFDKNNMIEDQIDDTDYGISYQDQHGYQYTLTSFHKPLWNPIHLQKFKKFNVNKILNIQEDNLINYILFTLWIK